MSYCFQFRCKNSQCIAKTFVCDGIPQCEDHSDEIYQQCKNKSCDEQNFQCDYGACIKKEYQCDGSLQCVDGSDEWPKTCNSTITESLRIRRDATASDSCAIPEPSLDKTITYECEGRGSNSCDTRNGYVPKFTVASIKCKPNYYSERKLSESICHHSTWIPPIDDCFKKCDKLYPVNVDLKCSRKGSNIACDENSLIAGSKVRPVCKQLYKYANAPPDYLEITCKEDGKWDNALFSCIPECGRPYSPPKTLISGGVEEYFGDAPWHVAIYNAEKILICAGVIINPKLVLSAAHCFQNDDHFDHEHDTSKYEIVVSKVSRNYSAIDNANQKIYKIKEIRFSNKGYQGINSYYAADIAAIILKEKITISPTVLPACIDWIGLSTSEPVEGTFAKVSGWGENEYGYLSEKLMTIYLPFISRERCLNIVPDDFKPFITFDKFCAGSEKGPGVLKGDSGGGLVFPRQHEDGIFYYLRGLVSLKQPSVTSIAAFTDLADHIEWISAVANEVISRTPSSSQKIPTK
ncbi:modular serine protease-like isoform X2 [Planococcus citri]|uniref:modular serine protease-like isoform X2 n=1 Tax=Planococcus citri TaxID=170843 RepID=UPI0031F89A23